jgi:hypothetical protein
VAGAWIPTVASAKVAATIPTAEIAIAPHTPAMNFMIAPPLSVLQDPIQ